MPPVENQPVEAKPEEKKPIVGIIYPPPEVRNIVDKTASFVARNGPEFETRIKQNELGNPKFNFLTQTDPYHAYYQHKVKEFQEGKAAEPVAPKPVAVAPPKPEIKMVIPEPIIPKDPPAEFEYVADPPSISAFDLDVVKLTAQFVARNGRQFLTNLMNREQKNFQFDFLRPQHSLFHYFTKLVEQYTKILIPPKHLLPKLRKEADVVNSVMDQVRYRVEWAKHQERERQRVEEAVERERVSYAQIDWHDFVVVETVDFQSNESGNFPPPTTPEEVGARLLAQERYEAQRASQAAAAEAKREERAAVAVGANTQVEDMEEDSDDEDAPKKAAKKAMPQVRAAPAVQAPTPVEKPRPPPVAQQPQQMIIRKDYNPKARSSGAGTSEQYQISPLTGERIPASKMAEHMRIGLLDPSWIEQRDRQINEKREADEVYAPGASAFQSLKQLAERRTDIFGAGELETQIGKKIGEEDLKKPEKITWDGHTSSMERVTQKAREHISIEEQIAGIHKGQGLVNIPGIDDDKDKIGPAEPRPPSPPPAPAPGSAAAAVLSGVPARPAPAPAVPVMATAIPIPVAPQPRPVMVVPPRPPVQAVPIMAATPMIPLPTPPSYAAPIRGDEPPSKKARTEENLIPEGMFLKQNPPNVQFTVQVPKITDKSEWKCHGQMLQLTLPLTDSVSVIKAKLHEALGMPAGKQKLQFDTMFIKDSNTLAFYNVTRGSTIQLQLKERGGRKK